LTIAPMSTSTIRMNDEIAKKNVLLDVSKTIFMPVGKAGSISIKKSLGDDLVLITKDEILRDYMSYSKVAIVRNPFERMVSTYSYFRDNYKYNLKIALSGFDYFIRAVFDTPDEISNLHYRSQVNLLSQDNIFLPDTVIDLHEIDKIKQYLPIRKLIYNQSTKSNHGPYQEYYTEELIDLMHKRFAVDFRELNYAF